MMNRIWYLNVV